MEMKTQLKISIVTISFNQVRFLEKAIRSVIDQDYPNLEYIVVDPGSTDGSRDIIERYRDRISKIIFEPDDGPSDGLNKGFAAASGDILGYLNSDDFILPGSLAWVRRFFDAYQNVDVLIGGIKMADSKGVLAWRGRVADTIELPRFATHGIHYVQQGTFFRKRLFQEVGGFNARNKTCWDLELMIDMAMRGARIQSVSKPLAAFRLHEESISGSGNKQSNYQSDLERIRQKVVAAGVAVVPRWLKSLYRLEHRFNPVRFLKQLYPVWPTEITG